MFGVTHWYPNTSLHGVTTQKTTVWICNECTETWGRQSKAHGKHDGLLIVHVGIWHGFCVFCGVSPQQYCRQLEVVVFLQWSLAPPPKKTGATFLKILWWENVITYWGIWSVPLAESNNTKKYLDIWEY